MAKSKVEKKVEENIEEEKTIYPEDEVKLEPEKESKTWNKIEMENDEDGNVFFTFPEVPMLKKVNRKTSYLVFFSVVIIMLLAFIGYFGNEKFSENKNAVAGISKNITDYNNAVTTMNSVVGKKIEVFQKNVSADLKKMNDEILSAKNGINATQLMQEDIIANQKQIYKKIKSGNYRIVKVEKKVDTLLERSTEEVPEIDEDLSDAGKTPPVVETKKVSKAIPEKVDKKGLRIKSISIKHIKK